MSYEPTNKNSAVWSYSIRLLTAGDAPVCDVRHPGPFEETTRAAQRMLRERPEYPAVEVCNVVLVQGGTATGSRVIRFSRKDVNP